VVSGGFFVVNGFENLDIQHDETPELVDPAAHQEFVKRCWPHGCNVLSLIEFTSERIIPE
jgi:hypothetical protein